MPGMTLKTKFVILWADELATAAKAVQEYLALPDEAPDDEVRRCSANLLNACTTALNGADDPDAVLLLSVKPPQMVAFEAAPPAEAP